MDMSKINPDRIKNYEEANGNRIASEQKKHTVNKSNTIQQTNHAHKPHNQNIPVKQYKKYFPNEYSNIRVSKDIANWLKTMQKITGDSSRSALITRFRQIVTPYILNNKAKQRKFKHDYKLVIKQEKLNAELNNKM